jgi:hypothetical protein
MCHYDESEVLSSLKQMSTSTMGDYQEVDGMFFLTMNQASNDSKKVIQ